MSPGATFERVYEAIKEQLGSGRYGAGVHLEPAVLSEDLSASITPVRDALHRLVGEGLVEAPRGDGFRTPIVTEVGRRHLYRWNAALLDAATRSRHYRATAAECGAQGDEDVLAFMERTFLRIGASSGNPEHLAAIAGLNDRLRPIRRAELKLLPGIQSEIDELVEKLAEGSVVQLRRPIAQFHRRRERAVADIVASMLA